MIRIKKGLNLPLTNTLMAGIAPLLLVILAITSTGCVQSSDQKKPIVYEFSGPIFGSNFSVKYRSPRNELDPSVLRPLVENLLMAYDREFSLWSPDSFLSRFNQSTDMQAMPVSSWAQQLYHEVYPIYKVTGGAYDPTVAPLVNRWGFGAKKRSQTPNEIPAASDISHALKLVGLDKLEVLPGQNQWRKKIPTLALDFNSVAPGHAADLIGKLLEEKGINDYLIDVGGELLAKGSKEENRPWMAGVETPLAEYGTSIITSFPLTGAVATSGNYRNFKHVKGKIISHIIDPRTGQRPSHQIISATVVAQRAAQADAWATTMMVLGPTALEASTKVGQEIQRLQLGIYLIEIDINGQYKIHKNEKMNLLLGQDRERASTAQ